MSLPIPSLLNPLHRLHPLRAFGPRLLALALGAGLLVGLGTGPAQADDRFLLRDGAADPYVLIMLDLSGSMHWEVGDSLPDMRGDDPNSKIYQAKEALYTVLEDLEGVRFGLAAFNQDGLRVRSKHYIYEAAENGPTVDGLIYPLAEARHVFGRTWPCNQGNNNSGDTLHLQGCETDPAELFNTYAERRARMFPKLGIDGLETTSVWIHQFIGGTQRAFQVDFTRISGTLGDATLQVKIDLERVDSGADDSKTITFNLVDQYLSWDTSAEVHDLTNGGQEGFFGQLALSDPSFNTETATGADMVAEIRPINGACFGWDPNTDDGSDDFGTPSINLKAPTVGTYPLSVGDVIPPHWDSREGRRRRLMILDRLAPNRLLQASYPPDPMTFVPDFGIANYFQNLPNANGQLNLTPALQAAGGTVLAPWGSTPLVASMNDVRGWFADWRDEAADEDASWGCRPFYLLLLTDGNETCVGNALTQAGTAANNLFMAGVSTYVVGFGVDAAASGDTLDAIAANGGTGEPVFRPDSPAELVDALNAILGQVQSLNSTFASAAVPSVQADVADKIYLTNFTPIESAIYWSGHLDGYLKPLPLNDDGTPARDRVCDPDDTSFCRLWDAGEEIVSQARFRADLDSGPDSSTGGLGPGSDERRVYYPQAPMTPNEIPQPRRTFWPPDSAAANADAVWEDLLQGFGFAVTSSDPDFGDFKDTGEEVIKEILEIKQEDILDPDGNPDTETYVLADIFHSDPLVIGSPSDFVFFNRNEYGNFGNEACDDLTDPNRGYRCFFFKHVFRRKVALFGSNEGQIHGIDAGIYRETDERFDNGTGRELFSVLPRSLLPTARRLSTNRSGHRFGMDGPLVVADVYIDPAHNGSPDPTDREWRTIVVGGMREGGRNIIAMDVTQPDILDSDLIPQVVLSGGASMVPDYVPSCHDGANGCGPVAYPAMLWEFVDNTDQDPGGGNGFPDMGQSWSTPNVGRISVNTGTAVEDRFVAIFGGGMTGSTGILGIGNWVYMVDIETGKLLYKRRLDGAVPGEPGAADTDFDGYIDVVYVGTLAGTLYKIDLNNPGTADLDSTTGLIEDADWEPFAIFDTGGRPIFFPAAVFFVPDSGKFGVAFGTGDRENLWAPEPAAYIGGRYYAFQDNGLTSGSPGLPLTSMALTEVQLDDDPLVGSLLGTNTGWYFELEAEERLITKSLVVGGLTAFTTFDPDPLPEDVLCSGAGQSRVYVVNTTNGNGFVPRDDPMAPPPPPNSPPEFDRFFIVDDFLTNPFLTSGVTQNAPPVSGGGTGDDDDDDDDPKSSSELTPDLLEIKRQLQGLFPPGCRFANFTMDLKTIRRNTGIVFIAPIPVCIAPHNWREL